MTEDKKPTTTKFQPKGKYYYGLGRRKSASARVRLYEGSGQVIINNKDYKQYLNPVDLIDIIKTPLKTLTMDDRFDIVVKVAGGGPRGQADAIRLGVARALLALDESLKKTLKSHKYLTRDSRVKERKKYGLKKARKAPQFSKR